MTDDLIHKLRHERDYYKNQYKLYKTDVEELHKIIDHYRDLVEFYQNIDKSEENNEKE